MATFIQLFYGPMFIGIVFNIMLYGVMVTQTYFYFTMYPDDRRSLKIFVLVLLICDTLNTAFDIAAIYDPLINNVGDVQALSQSTWMFASDSATTAIIAALVQCFFAWRLKVLTRKNWIVGIVLVCAVTQLLGGLGCCITLAIDPSFEDVRRFRFMGIIWNTSAALADVIIAVALVWHLWKHKTGVPATDNMINKIIRLTVQTGFITALFAVLTLILYFVLSSGYDLIFHMPLAKLYTNSLMSTLNSRRMWLADFCESDSMSFAAHTTGGGGGGGGHWSQRGSRANVNVNVLRSDAGGRARGPDRIVIGVDSESHQMADFSDGKDSASDDASHYAPPSARPFVREEKRPKISAAEAV